MNELHFNTELCKKTSITTALLAEYIRDICELEGRRKIVIPFDEFEEMVGIKPTAAERALREVRKAGFISFSYHVSKGEFKFLLRKKPPKADNTLLTFPTKCKFSPKRMLILTILQESGMWMTSGEISDAADCIFSRDAANMALNDMHRKGELLKRNASVLGSGRGKRIEFKIAEVAK